MKFLIQKINGQIRHDLSFTLIESVRFQNWLVNGSHMTIKYLNTKELDTEFEFKHVHWSYVPIGSVEFVSQFLFHFYGLTLKPINVPVELFYFANREIFNGTENDIKGKMFVKSNDYIKGLCGIFDEKTQNIMFPDGNYQFSKIINIDSEWRSFVFKGKLVGLQNYSGEFTKFPNVTEIKRMISAYKSAPIAYTLDVGVGGGKGTFVIECHPMVSVGLYGFADHSILTHMFYKSFKEIINK